MRQFAAAVAIVGIAPALLAGCSLFRKEDDRSCPTAAIVRDLATVQKYRPGGGRDLTDVSLNAGLARLTGSCVYRSDGVEVEMKLAVIGERGPAFDGTAAPLEYFVAIAGPDHNIIAKQVFATTLDFSGGRNRTGSSEELVQRIPLPKGADGSLYSIAVGFQLTPEELEQNRQRRGG